MIFSVGIRQCLLAHYDALNKVNIKVNGVTMEIDGRSVL